MPLVFRSINAALYNVTVTNNNDTMGVGYGGSIRVETGTTSIFDSVIRNSAAVYGGGGIVATSGAILNVTRVKFFSNRSGGGAGIQVERSSPTNNRTEVHALCVEFRDNFTGNNTGTGAYGGALLAGNGGNAGPVTVTMKYAAFYIGLGYWRQDVHNLLSSSSVTIDQSWWQSGTPDVSSHVQVTGTLPQGENPTDQNGTGLKPECVSRQQQQDVTIDISPTTISQVRTIPIPRRDSVDFSINLTNVSDEEVSVADVDFTWLWDPGTAQEAMTPVQSVPIWNETNDAEILWQDLHLRAGQFGVLSANETINLTPRLRIERSGIIEITVAVTLTNGEVIVETLPLNVPITQINFNDPRVKALMFWMLFNETSEDSFENFFTQSLGNATATPGPTPVNTTFLTVAPYCDASSLNPAKNNVAGEQPSSQNWLADANGNIKYVTHCIPPSFWFIQAQTIINDFINTERNSNSTTFISYAANFGGSIGRADYPLWDDYEHCDELKNGQPTGQKLRPYQSLIAGEQVTLDWLFSYLECQVNTPSSTSVTSGRALIFSRAYSRLMPEINSAITSFYTQPDYDPSDTAFFLKNAAFINALNKDQAIKTCVGGCLPNGAGYAQPFESITQTMIVQTYDTHISQLQGRITGEPGYNPNFPSILRPVLWTERRELRGIVDGELSLVGHNYGGYTWVTVIYQEALAENAIHIPR
jgi:hypothetical protein